MVLYVVYRASMESKARSTIPRRLKELGCQQIHRAFWKVNEKNARQVLKVLENNQPILLKRLREIRNPQLAKRKEFSGLGSLIVVFFTLPKDANREKMKNFLKRAPCIRLRRSVYAFSQRQPFYDREQKLVDAQRFAKFIREMRGETKIISRVVIVNRESAERLRQETRERVEREVAEIVAACKELFMKAHEANETAMLRDRYLRIKRRFLALKKVAAVYDGWMKMDSSKSLMRGYHGLRKVNSALQKRG